MATVASTILVSLSRLMHVMYPMSPGVTHTQEVRDLVESALSNLWRESDEEYVEKAVIFTLAVSDPTYDDSSQVERLTDETTQLGLLLLVARVITGVSALLALYDDFDSPADPLRIALGLTDADASHLLA